MTDITALLDYITAHPWAGWLALGAITLLLSRKSQIDAWAEAHPRVAGVHKLLRSLGVDPWMLIQSLSLIVRGRLPNPPKMKLPVDDDDGPPTPRDGRPVPPSGPAAAMLLLAGALALSGALPACSPAATPEAQGAQAAQTARLAYNAAAVSVQALADVHATWMEVVVATNDPAAAQAVLPVARKVTTAIESAKGALGRARQYLDAGEGEAKVRQQIREAIGFADLAIDLLAGAGRPLPQEALDALAFMRGLLGGGK